jgi:hypothetical protein
VNKDLYGKNYPIPENILAGLKNYGANETIKNLLSSNQISYSLIKKCIHRMENGEKDTLGGDQFYNWLKQTLNSDRGSLETTKKNKSETGMANAYNQEHSKQNVNTLNRPSKSHSKLSSELKINESLKRINEIMSKII